MRKLIMEFAPNDAYRKMAGPFFAHIKYIRIMEFIKVDFDKGETLVLAECEFQDGVDFDNLEIPEMIAYMNVVTEDHPKFTALFKSEYPDELKGVLRHLDLDLIWTTPFEKSLERVVVSIIGSEANLNRYIEFVDGMEGFGKIANITYQKATTPDRDILSSLTDRQREVMLKAKSTGYYDYPRKVSSEKIAEEMGISKATFIEHLRKAEQRLVNTLLEGRS